MNKNAIFLLVVFLAFCATFLSYVQYSFAQTAQSNCITTKVGNPGPNVSPSLPAGCDNGGGGGAQDVVKLAKQYLKTGTYAYGTPDRNWASSDPNAGKAPIHFDCSGFSGWVWYWATGGKVNLGASTIAIWSSSDPKYQKFVSTDITKLLPGDLVFFGSVSGPGHMGIYEGPGECGSNDCFLEYYTTPLPGRENSLSKNGDWVGFVRPVIQ